MCLAVPAQLIECSGQEATADLGGNRVRVSLVLTPQAQVGDWVLIHAGFAIQKIEAEELTLIQETLRSVAEAGHAAS